MAEKLLGIAAAGMVEEKSSSTVRGDQTTLLRVEVVGSFPAHADGKIIYHTVDKKFYGSADGTWL